MRKGCSASQDTDSLSGKEGTELSKDLSVTSQVLPQEPQTHMGTEWPL